MIYREKDILRLIEKFENRSLPKDEWTHEAHLVVAIWYASQFDYQEAFQKVRQNIISFNEAVGTANTAIGGYHETLTRFWLSVAGKFINEQKDSSLEALANGFIQSKQSQKTYPLQFYTKENLFSILARAQWLSPGQQPFEEGY